MTRTEQNMWRLMRLVGAACLLASHGRTAQADILDASVRRTETETAVDSVTDERQPGYQSGTRKAGIDEGLPIDHGCVIVGGDYLPPPYTIGRRGRDIYVNGRHCAVLRSQLPTRSRNRSGSRERFKVGVADIERALLRDEMILAFDLHTLGFLHGMDGVELLGELFDTESLDRRVELVMQSDISGVESVGTAEWARILQQLRPSPELIAFLQDNSDESDEEDVSDEEDGSNDDSHAGVVVGLGDSSAYCLTVAGMVLAVVAFGRLLSHRPEQRGRWSDRNPSPDGKRLVIGCVVLMSALCLFDLLCTLRASASGGFHELNPWAAALMSRPAALAAYKAVCTLVGAGILWRLWRYNAAQLASWWLCLLCTILAFRWVTFNSMFLQ